MCATVASAQSEGWYPRLYEARAAAKTAQADATVMADDALPALDDLADRVDRLVSGMALSESHLEWLDISGERARQWQVMADMVAADNLWRVAEADWIAMWQHLDRDPDRMRRQFDDARWRYEVTLILALESLERIEIRHQWIDDHLERIATQGWR